MAKKSYKIPTSLDRNVLDHEVNLSAGGFQIPPQPIKVMLTWVVSIVVVIWLCMQTFLKDASPLLLLLVVVFWLMATAFLSKYNKNKEMNFAKIPALYSYATPGARRITTRRDSNPSGFYSVARIDSIDETGLIRFADGTVGQGYLVVGSGSILVFEEDKRAILDRVDAFKRKIDTDVELLTITTKEPQRVYRQIKHLEDLNVGLQNRHPELVELMQERFDILVDHVGGAFSSIHQYMLLKGDTLSALQSAHMELVNEAEESSLMFKQITMMDKIDLVEMLRVFFQSEEQSAPAGRYERKAMEPSGVGSHAAA